MSTPCSSHPALASRPTPARDSHQPHDPAAAAASKSIDDALQYVTAVKKRFRENRAVYYEFMRALAHYKNSSKQRIDLETLFPKVERLLDGHEDLVLGFKAFLPASYKEPPVEALPQGESGQRGQPEAEPADPPPPQDPSALRAEAERQRDAALAAKAAAEAERDAALAAQTAAEAERDAALAAQQAAEQEVVAKEDRAECKICFEAPREALFSPCMHLVCCGGCAARIMRRRPAKCPYCTQLVTEQLKVFCPA